MADGVTRRRSKPATRRASREQLLELEYSRARLIVPKLPPSETGRATFAQGAVSRATPLAALELRTTTDDAPTALQRIGLDDLEKLQVSREPAKQKGVFTRLSSLGMTAAFFGREEDEGEAMGLLGKEYAFVPNYSLSIASPVRTDEVPATVGRTTPDTREWPEQSGVAQAHAVGIRGGGVLVGVLDTGIDADHAEFNRQTVHYRYVSLFPTSPYWPPRDVRGFDTDGHGTHVCGILAGRNIGVAPEAKLYVASVIESETTRTSLIRVAYGLDWILRQFSRPDNERLPAVLNMSLGFPPGEFTDLEDVMRTLLRTLIQANVLPVVAIGNDGPGEYGYPAGFSEVLGVGAVDFSHRVAPFSGSGTPTRGVNKPDLVGYGVGIYASIERDYEGNSMYKRLSGTSMAAPYVAGIASLYRCLQPSMTVDQVRDELIDGALRLQGQRRSRRGAGLARFR